MGLSPLQKLDRVIGILANSGGNQKSKAQIIFEANDEITYVDIEMLFNKLIKDGYAEKPYGDSNPLNQTIYVLTFEGLIFYQKGGYKKEEKIIKLRLLKDEVYTYSVAIGTGLAGLYALFEMLKWVYHHFQ